MLVQQSAAITAEQSAKAVVITSGLKVNSLFHTCVICRHSLCKYVHQHILYINCMGIPEISIQYLHTKRSFRK